MYWGFPHIISDDCGRDAKKLLGLGLGWAERVATMNNTVNLKRPDQDLESKHFNLSKFYDVS